MDFEKLKNAANSAGETGDASQRQVVAIGGVDVELTASDWIGSDKTRPRRRTLSANSSEGIGLGGAFQQLLGGIKSSSERTGVGASLPRWVSSAADVELRSLVVGLEEAPAPSRAIEVIFISLGLGIGGEWPIIEHLLSVSGLSVELAIASPEDPKLRELDASASGKILLPGATIAVTAIARMWLGEVETPQARVAQLKGWGFDYGQNEMNQLEAILREEQAAPPRLDFEVEGKLSDGTIAISDIARHFGFAMGSDDQDHSDPDPLRNLVVSKLDMRASTRTSAFNVLIELNLPHNPNAPASQAVPLFANFELRDFILSIEGSPSLGMAGVIGCTLDFSPPGQNKIELHLRAEFGGAGGGWIFEGEIEVGLEQWKAIFETHFVKPLGFEAPELPIESRGTNRDSNIAVRFLFNTGTREISLSLRAALELGDIQARTNLDIALAQDTAQAWTVRLKGALDLSPEPNETMRFDLAIDYAKQKGLTLSAIYGDSGANNLIKLVNKVANLKLPESLAINLSGAAYAYRKAPALAAAMPDFHMLAFNVKGTLDVGAISVPGVAFIRDSAGAGIHLHLEFQFAWASEALKADDPLYAAIGGQGFQMLPAGLAKGANFGALLRLDEEIHTLTVPVEAQQKAFAGAVGAPAPQPQPQQVKTQDGGKWIELHRQLGPLRVERVGMRFHTQPQPSVALFLDAGFTFAGLQVSLDGLEMRSPLDTFDPTFALAGLGVAYRNPSIQIGGALLRYERMDGQNQPYTGFAGNVIVNAPTFSLSAIGDFSTYKKQPSLFIYAVLDYPLGGPPFFFVTGLTAGLGYNRAIILPEAEDVERFPLVAWALQSRGDATPPGPQPTAERPPATPLDALEKLQSFMPPAVGSGFAAIGVAFTSFKIVNSFALLVAKFGPRFELDLIGTSRLVTPPGKAAYPLAQATLNLRARYAPDEGTLLVRAVLGADSFVLSRDCHLSGGFAFAAWFKDSGAVKAGDFVLTLGGYHPSFRGTPDRYPHYPVVPRLGVEWAISQNLSFKGSIYFALTAGAVMAGGRFEAVWQSDNLRVSFLTSADFVMTFKPYHYDAKASVLLHVDVTFNLFGTHHLTLDAGADLHLWGPEFTGRAHLYLHVVVIDVTFDVSFGNADERIEPIAWEEFRASLVPAEAYAITARAGLIDAPAKQGAGAKGVRDLGVFSGGALELSVESAIPFSKITIGDHARSDDRRPGVRPAGLPPTAFENHASVALRRWDGKAFEPLTIKDVVPQPAGLASGTRVVKVGDAFFLFSPISKAQPAGLWGSPDVEVIDGKTYLKSPAVTAEMFTQALLSGFTLGVWADAPEAQAVSVAAGQDTTKAIPLFPAPARLVAVLTPAERDEALHLLGMKRLPAAA